MKENTPSIYRILDDNFGIEDFGIGFRKNDMTFREALNNAFNTLKQNGKANLISEKWFGADIIK